MFRKLVSNLPFSPALIGQIGFYARRLKREELTRRTGLILTALALVAQSFAVFSPPQSANAASTSDFIYGGVSSVSAVLSAYDNPNTDIKKIMDYAGITRGELAAMKDGGINSQQYGKGAGAWLTWGRTSRFSAAQGQVEHNISGTIVYSKPLWLYDTTSWTTDHGSYYPAFIGTSAKMGTFAIMKSCGNLLTTKLPAPTPVPPIIVAVCRPGVGIIQIPQTDKQPSDLEASSGECQPASTCSLLTVNSVDRTHVTLTAQAGVDRGATVSGYTFTIRKDSATGATTVEKTYPSTATSYKTESIELATSGTYFASVTVHTSLGDRSISSNANCGQTFSIAQPSKCQYNLLLIATSPECQPCPGNTTLWYKSPDCVEKVIKQKVATNLTQNKDASSVVANESDAIQYTLTIENTGKTTANVSFQEDLGDVLEYATLQDNGGGTLDNSSKVLSWQSVKLQPGEKQTRTYVVSVLPTIPTMARGQSEPSSYDCVMNNVFGNNVQIQVNCPLPKTVEQTVSKLPSTGPTENMIFASVLAAVVTFFYARSRQLGKEVRLIRREFSANAI